MLLENESSVNAIHKVLITNHRRNFYVEIKKKECFDLTELVTLTSTCNDHIKNTIILLL